MLLVFFLIFSLSWVEFYLHHTVVLIAAICYHDWKIPSKTGKNVQSKLSHIVSFCSLYDNPLVCNSNYDEMDLCMSLSKLRSLKPSLVVFIKKGGPVMCVL